MTSLKSAVSALVLSTLALGHGAVPAAAGSPELRVKPLQAVNVDAGVKRAIGYYLANAGNCDLTVLMSDSVSDGAERGASASRFTFKVFGGTSAQVDTIDGTGLSFTCSAGASDMTLRVFQRVAESPVRSRTPAE